MKPASARRIKLTRRWARRGTRPRAPRDQRTEWAYIFGAICPAKGKGAGLVMPWCDTDAMAAHLIEISAAVDPGAQAVLIVDQAGWHLTPKLAIPDNITVLALPPRSPELNPVENVWQFMRDNWLSNRIFKSYEDIVALCCQAWNNLIDQPWKIMSLGMRKMGAWVLINDRWYNGTRSPSGCRMPASTHGSSISPPTASTRSVCFAGARAGNELAGRSFSTPTWIPRARFRRAARRPFSKSAVHGSRATYSTVKAWPTTKPSWPPRCSPCGRSRKPESNSVPTCL